MIWVQNHVKYKEVVRIDPDTNEFALFHRDHEALETIGKMTGLYRFLSGLLVAHYSFGRKVWFRIGEVVRSHDSGLALEASGRNLSRRLAMRDGGKVIAEVAYAIDPYDMLPTDIDGTDPEEYDFGLQMVRVLRSSDQWLKERYGE